MHTGKLSFLNHIGHSRSGYRSAEWLISTYEDSEWQAKFENGVTASWNFDVELYDGSRLIDPKHAALLDTLKQWLCIQTHPIANGNRSIQSRTAHTRVVRTLHLIDHLLIQGPHLKIADYGLKLLTENDIKNWISATTREASVAESIYDWGGRIRHFLLEKIATVTSEDVHQISQHQPYLLTPCESTENGLGLRLRLSQDELILARVWLWKNDLYHQQQTADGPSYRPNLAAIENDIYINTLWGTRACFQSQMKAQELAFGEDRGTVIEKKRVACRNYEDGRADSRKIAVYVKILKSLGRICHDDPKVPRKPFAALDQNFMQSLDLKDAGRHTMLPQKVVFDALRNAIDFSLTYGDELVDAYLCLANAKRKPGKKFYNITKAEDLARFLGPKLLDLGVKSWSIHSYGFFGERPQARQAYFADLKASRGLNELLVVLVGAINIILGTLMARRVGELTDLTPCMALDKTGRYLTFRNRKSGIYEARQLVARPIPEIAAKQIRLLERMHAGLPPNFRNEAPLLTFPQANTGKLVRSPNRVYRSLDVFCDYFEIDGIDDDSRFYIRLHQLRQFFAIAFFWSAGFGGLETLRWFMGHLDVRHIWNYITQNTPGAILRHVKIDYAIQHLRGGSPDSADLANFLFEHYGTRDFALIETARLETYIGELLDEGVLHVEPQFITEDGGKLHRVLIIVGKTSQH